MAGDLASLPEGLPVPEDDGACDHLAGMEMPRIRLAATSGISIDVREACADRCALFFYPRTGRPEEDDAQAHACAFAFFLRKPS